MSKIHFLFTDSLKGYAFNPLRPQGIKFEDPLDNVKIEIRAKGKEQDLHFGHLNFQIDVATSCTVTDNQFKFVENLINKRIVDPKVTPVELPYSEYGEELVSESGKSVRHFSITSDFLPEDIQEICLNVNEKLERKANRFVQLLRWVNNANGPVNIFDDGWSDFRLQTH